MNDNPSPAQKDPPPQTIAPTPPKNEDKKKEWWEHPLWRYLPGAILLIAAFLMMLGQTVFADKTCPIGGFSIFFGVLLIVGIFIFSCSYRLLIAIVGIMGFNICLILKGTEIIIKQVDAHQTNVVNKETAFIIAVAILAWLAISCYSLSLLKDSQLENEKDT